MEQTPSLNAVTLRFRKEKCVRRKTLCGFFLRDFHQPAAAPQSAPPVPFGPESSEANRVRKRRNSHQSAVFGKAGNGTVVGISELAAGEGFEPSHTESESAVLPLHKPAVLLLTPVEQDVL